MNNVFYGHEVVLEREGNAVDAILLFDVRVKDFYNYGFRVLRVQYWVNEDGQLVEIDRRVCRYLGDYQIKLMNFIEKCFYDYDKTGFDAEADKDPDSYVCRYDTVMYSLSPKIRSKVVDKIVENDGHYDNELNWK